MATTNETDFPSLAIPAHANTGDKKKKPPQKTPFKLVITIFILFLIFCAIAFTFSKLLLSQNGNAVADFNSTRNYKLTPFDELDAQQICQLQTKEVHGKQLITSYLDTHSSRFETSMGIYKIFLIAHIGTRTEYEEAKIHCYIHPKQHLIKHYKTVFPKNASLMSRALKFFSL